MNIYRRTEDVLEIQEGPSTAVRGRAACDLMVDDKLPFITLLSMIRKFCTPYLTQNTHVLSSFLLEISPSVQCFRAISSDGFDLRFTQSKR